MYFEASLKERALKFLRLVSGSYAGLPNDITIEVSTACGQDCPMCFRAPLGIRAETMPYPLFSSLLDGLKSAFGAKEPRYLNFVGLGEPLLNEALGDMLKLAKKTFPRTALNVSTSLAVPDHALFSALSAENLVNRVSVSIDNPEGGGSLHPFTQGISENLAFLKEMKKKGGFGIRLQTLITSREAAEKVIGLARNTGADEVQLMRIDLHAFEGAPPVRRPPLAEERAIVAHAERLAAKYGIRCRNNNSYDIFMDLASFFDRRCLITDDSIFIDVQGNVLPCFYLRGFSFGNLSTQTLAEIGETRRASSFYRKQASLCKGCDIYKRKYAGGAA